MADLKTLSDEELDALIAVKTKKPQAAKSAGVDLSSIPDEELDRLISQKIGPSTSEPKGFIQTIGETYDKYAGAPVRAGFSELTRSTPEFGKPKPSLFGNLVGAGRAFTEQFGEDPSLAPTGKDIAVKRFGLSDQPVQAANTSFLAAKGGIAPEAAKPESITVPTNASPAGYVGAGLDAALDIGNVIPVGAIAKTGAKAAEASAKGIGRFTLSAAKKTPGIGNLTEGASRVIDNFVNPKQAGDFAELAAIAEKNGIDLANAPEAVEFGRDSFISRASRVQAEGALGEPRLEKALKFQQETSDAFDAKLAQIGNGAPLSRVDAGVHLRESFDRAADELFETVGENTYNKVVQAYPGLQLSDEAKKSLVSKLAGIEKFAKGQLKRGISDLEKSQATGLLNVIDAIRNTNGSVKQAVEELQAIGAAAYKPRNSLAAIPPDIDKLRDLYNTIKDGIYKTIETDVKDGESVLGALKISNDLMSEFFGNREAIGNILGNPNLAPEQVFDRILKNTKQVDALKNILQPQDLARLKSTYLDSLVKRDDLTGTISWKQLNNALKSKANRSVVERLFEPEELNELLSIAKLGERAGIPIMSTSGTGASNSFLGMIKDVPFRLGAETVIESQKARARGLSLPKEAAPRNVTPGIRLGPAGIGAKEAVGLRLPQQISIQQRNKEKERGR